VNQKPKRRQNRKSEVVENYYNFYVTIKAEQINCGSRITDEATDELIRLARNGKLTGRRC